MKTYLENLKNLLTESLLTNGDIKHIEHSTLSVDKKIRKILRTYVKADSCAPIEFESNNLKPTLKGERGYWYIDCINNDDFKFNINKMVFKKKPYLTYHLSDYRIEVGEQWLMDLLQNKV
jgi:hypothetical protein